MALTTRTGAPVAEARWTPWVFLHTAFALVAAISLAIPGPALGWRVLALVLGYHAAVVATARATGDRLLWRAWTILAPLSVLMVLPDWFLSEVLGVLHFPDNGGPFIGTVPLSMAGMWTVALMPVVAAGIAAAEKWGERSGVLAAALAGATMFIGAEFAAPALGLWEPVGVATRGGVAVYVIPPEIVLSLCAYLIVRWLAMPRWAGTGLVVLIPFTYLGLLATSYQILG